jgi:SnoaL-like domain
METQDSVGTGYRAFRAIWDGANGDKLRGLFSDDFQFHNLDDGHEAADLNGLRRRMASLRAAHPSARLRVGAAFGAESHIAFDWTFGDPNSSGCCMLRLDQDRVVELWELNGALAA